MPSLYAKTSKPDNAPKLVIFVVYPDIVLLDLVGPLQVFSHAIDPKMGANGYQCLVISAKGGTIKTNTVVSIPSEPMEHCFDRDIHTLIIVGGSGANIAMNDAIFVGKITQLASKASRVCSVCSGALVLAATGLLDGRRAVTHWDDCKTLQNRFPKIRVEIDPIYIKDGHVWTSAGITAGMDMALAIVAEDLGRLSALEVARSMVTHMARSGGQSQFSPTLDRQLQDKSGQFEKLHHWIEQNLISDLRVDVLAEQMNMSARNFSRLYAQQMGVSPAKAVEAMRIEAARTLLETSDLGVKQVAAKCGFTDEERMRRAFIRLLRVSPSDYRHGFKAT